MVESNVVEMAPITAYMLEIILGVMTIVGAWVAKKVQEKFKIEEDGKINELINEAISVGINYAYHQLEKQGKKLNFETENELIAVAAEYVVKGVPKGLQHFGITRERVEQMVEARLAGKSQPASGE